MKFHAVAAFFFKFIVIIGTFTCILVNSGLITLFTGHFIFGSHFLYGVLIAVILYTFFTVLGAFLLSSMLLFVTIELLLVVLIFFFFTFFFGFLFFAHHHHDAAVFILVHQLILLNHALKVLEDHLTREESPDERLHLNKRAKESLLLLESFLVLLNIVVFDPIFIRVFNVVVVLAILKILVIGIFMLLFIRSDHHILFFAIEVAIVCTSDALGILVLILAMRR